MKTFLLLLIWTGGGMVSVEDIPNEQQCNDLAYEARQRAGERLIYACLPINPKQGDTDE